jgi:predicted nucleotidyltransferase
MHTKIQNEIKSSPDIKKLLEWYEDALEADE